MMPPCGLIVLAMNLMIGSSAKAQSVMESGHPCLTPEVKRRVNVRTLLMKMVSWAHFGPFYLVRLLNLLFIFKDSCCVHLLVDLIRC